MINTKDGYNDLIYTPIKECLVTQNTNKEPSDKFIIFFNDLTQKILTVNDENFNDFVNASNLDAQKKQSILESANPINSPLAKQCMIDFFQHHGINENQLDTIIQHWNKNVTGHFILESMQENAQILGKTITATERADITLENNQIIVKILQKDFILIDQLNNKIKPRPIHTSYFTIIGKPTILNNPSIVISHLALTRHGFKVANIVFSDNVIKGLYEKDSLKQINEVKKRWTQELTENIAIYLNNKNLTYQAIKEENGFQHKTDQEIKELLEHPKRLKNLNKSSYKRSKALQPYPCSLRDAFIYNSVFYYLRKKATEKQKSFLQDYPMYEEGDNYLHLDWINYKNNLFSVLIDSIKMRTADLNNQFIRAFVKLINTTNNESIPESLRLSGKKVVAAISKFTAKKSNSIDSKDLKTLTRCINETNNVIHYFSNRDNPTDNLPFSKTNHFDMYTKTIKKVMGMDRNKWEVIRRAMIGVVGAVLLATSIAAIAVVTSGAALPVIIAGLALGIKIGVIASTATVGSIGLFGGTFFAKYANDGKIACACKNVLKSARKLE